MKLIVIEGDNGTGKDTLALKIQKQLGYKIITNEPEIKKINKKSKQYEGKERVKRFLDYGKKCSDIVNKTKENALIVRYWISTLAAAYADNVYTYKQVCKIEKSICSKLYKPDLIICLWCDYKIRIERIEKRISNDFDDISLKRNEKYKYFLKQYERKTDIKWINIETTNKSKEEVFKEAYYYINKDNI